MVASDFKKGDEVFGLAYGGAYAEYIAVSVKMIVHKPKELSFEQCAGIPEVWFTAIQALYLVGSMEKGMNVLFHAGASSIPLSPPSIPPVPDNAYLEYYTRYDSESCSLLLYPSQFHYPLILSHLCSVTATDTDFRCLPMSNPTR